MTKELQALRKLEAALKSKEDILRSIPQEWEMVLEAMEAIEKARQEDKKHSGVSGDQKQTDLYKQELVNVFADMKKEKESLKKKNEANQNWQTLIEVPKDIPTVAALYDKMINSGMK
jgi:hypothetical protein